MLTIRGVQESKKRAPLEEPSGNFMIRQTIYPHPTNVHLNDELIMCSISLHDNPLPLNRPYPYFHLSSSKQFGKLIDAQPVDKRVHVDFIPFFVKEESAGTWYIT